MEIIVTPERGRVDEPVAIQLKDLTPHSHVMLNATTEDALGQTWKSWAKFIADNQGTVDVAQQAPLAGSYRQADAMGLVWSMQPANNKLPVSMFAAQLTKPITITLETVSDKKTAADKQITRLFQDSGVQRIDVEEKAVTGTLFLPRGVGPHPAIALLPGSTGMALHEPIAALLAAHGYAVLNIGYFGYKKLPPELYEIPLETIAHGIRWLEKRPEVDANRMVALGFSKGAEALLATAAYFNDLPLRALIAVSPSHVVWQGVGKGRPQRKSSWTLAGKSLPFLSYREDILFKQLMYRALLRKLHLDKLKPSVVAARFLSGYKAALKQRQRMDVARIPVEKIHYPLMLVSGGDDAVWPSSDMSREIVKRLQQHQFEPVHLDYPKAGHIIRYPYLPTTVSFMTFQKICLAFGGSAEANAKAAADNWQEMLRFLAKSCNTD